MSIARALSLPLIAVIMLYTAHAQQPTAPHPWSYSGESGPEHWTGLDPANSACTAGLLESPIDLAGAKVSPLPPLTFDYHPGTWKVLDNGHTVQVIVPPGNFLRVAGESYELQQFHFHHPSEEAIAGKHFDMVAHLVHKNGQGKLAVVALLFTGGAPSSLITALWSAIPHQQGEIEALPSAMDLKALLPSDLGYYTFQGSLTTPPCTEGVRWFVLRSPIAISPAQEHTFAALYPDNARPLQPLNGRPVAISK